MKKKNEIYDLIEFEQKYNLINRKLLNMNYWDFCRSTFFYEIKTLKNNINHVINVNKKINSKDRKLLIKNLKNYFFFKHENIDLLFIADPRRIKNKNTYLQPFVDEIIEKISQEYSSMIIEEPNWKAWNYGLPAHLTPEKTNNIKYTDLYENVFLIKRKLIEIFKKNEIKLIYGEFEYLKKIINEYFKIDISKKEKEFIDLILYFKYMKNPYKKILKSINPKIVILNYRPTYFKNLITIICNELSIPTIELQHGIISNEDPIDKVNPNQKDFKTRAKYLFTFGERLVSKELLPFKKNEIKNIGYPHLENKKNKKYPLPEIMDKEHKYILIISQSIIGDNIANFAASLSRILENNKKYKIIYKYHPNELEKDYTQLKKDNIIEIKNMNYDLFHLQKFSYCQIGSYSTGLYEGIILGLPTIIIKNILGSEATINNLKDFEKGIYITDSTDNIADLLDNLESPSKKDINKLWKNDSTNNFKKEIRKIIKSSIK